MTHREHVQLATAWINSPLLSVAFLKGLIQGESQKRTLYLLVKAEYPLIASRSQHGHSLPPPFDVFSASKMVRF